MMGRSDRVYNAKTLCFVLASPERPYFDYMFSYFLLFCYHLPNPTENTAQLSNLETEDFSLLTKRRDHFKVHLLFPRAKNEKKPQASRCLEVKEKQVAVERAVVRRRPRPR